MYFHGPSTPRPRAEQLNRIPVRLRPASLPRQRRVQSPSEIAPALAPTMRRPSSAPLLPRAPWPRPTAPSIGRVRRADAIDVRRASHPVMPEDARLEQHAHRPWSSNPASRANCSSTRLQFGGQRRRHPRRARLVTRSGTLGPPAPRDETQPRRPRLLIAVRCASYQYRPTMRPPTRVIDRACWRGAGARLRTTSSIVALSSSRTRQLKAAEPPRIQNPIEAEVRRERPAVRQDRPVDARRLDCRRIRSQRVRELREVPRARRNTAAAARTARARRRGRAAAAP